MALCPDYFYFHVSKLGLYSIPIHRSMYGFRLHHARNLTLFRKRLFHHPFSYRNRRKKSPVLKGRPLEPWISNLQLPDPVTITVITHPLQLIKVISYPLFISSPRCTSEFFSQELGGHSSRLLQLSKRENYGQPSDAKDVYSLRIITDYHTSAYLHQLPGRGTDWTCPDCDQPHNPAILTKIIPNQWLNSRTHWLPGGAADSP